MDYPNRLESLLRSGAKYWNPAVGRWTGSLHKPADEIVKKPHVFGVTREIEQQIPGSWVGSLSDYRSPRFGFSRSEQRLLQLALRGGTGGELSDELCVSLSAVKRAWRTIYGRAAVSLREHVRDDGLHYTETPHRGKQKKQRLLDYIRKHPEELRPVSRKLWPQNAARSHPSADAGKRFAWPGRKPK